MTYHIYSDGSLAHGHEYGGSADGSFHRPTKDMLSGAYKERIYYVDGSSTGGGARLDRDRISGRDIIISEKEMDGGDAFYPCVWDAIQQGQYIMNKVVPRLKTIMRQCDTLIPEILWRLVLSYTI